MHPLLHSSDLVTKLQANINSINGHPETPRRIKSHKHAGEKLSQCCHFTATHSTPTVELLQAHRSHTYLSIGNISWGDASLLPAQMNSAELPSLVDCPGQPVLTKAKLFPFQTRAAGIATNPSTQKQRNNQANTLKKKTGTKQLPAVPQHLL